MYLKRFVFVNWGNIPNNEFEMGPINLFSGGNGSGKTTAADAIQTVMTAAHETLFQYNPGQDETTQRGRGGKRVRTLASYVLGCDDGSYARLDPTDGYLAAIFHPTEGETADPFTAVVGVRAWLDTGGSSPVARQDDAAFWILPNCELNLEHFQRPSTVGPYVVPLDKLPNLIMAEFGNKALEKYDTKKAYLRRLYGALRGREDSISEREAVAAARAFSRFMAYKPVSSINAFVAEEILERKDLGEAIRSVSGQLKTIHAMEREASSLIESITLLEHAGIQAQLATENWLALTVAEYTIARNEHWQGQTHYLGEKEKQETLRRSLAENEEAIALASQRVEQVHDQLVSVEAQRQGVDELRRKDELEKKRSEAAQQLVKLGPQLLQHDQVLQTNSTHARTILEAFQTGMISGDLPDIATSAQKHLAQEAIEKGHRANIKVQTLLQQDLTGDLSPLEANLDHAHVAQHAHNALRESWHVREPGQESKRDRLARVREDRQRRLETVLTQQRAKQAEMARLEAKQVNYPSYVESALTLIRARCPQADPRVLCDHVEVKDPRWQASIEGYLGGARFSILVNAEYEAEAIKLVRSMPGRDVKARVIQGKKAKEDADRLASVDDSIIEVLNFTHAAAKSYLLASYGNVVRVDSAEALRHTRRGLTADGMASGNYTLFRCDVADSELVFGVAARERALNAKRSEAEQLVKELQVAQTRLQDITRLLDAVDRLQPVQYAHVMSDMLAAQRELLRLEDALVHMDLTEHKALEYKLDQLKSEARHWRTEQEQLNRDRGRLETELRTSTRRVEGLAGEQQNTQEKVELWEKALSTHHADWPEFDLEARLAHADNEAKKLDKNRAFLERDQLQFARNKHERELDDAIQRHNQKCRPGDVVMYSRFSGEYDSALFKAICGVRRELDRVYNVLKNNILVDKHSRLKELKESFNHAFVTHLCHAIYQSIQDGNRQIELMNKELQHHRFGADRETFRFAREEIPEYRDYLKFFREAVDLGDDANLFSTKMSAKSTAVRDEIMTMLLDEDEHKALRELERIADYRNYHRYEIFKEVEGKPPIALSEYGTGSGGQLETPAYIIRSAAITSAFRFTEGVNHLRMVLVDEAFSKMDETRSREVIHYLTHSLGLQLVFIMPTSKCGPFMDLISNEYVFAKVPSAPRGQLRTRVLVDRKQCNVEKIQALWSQHRRTVFQQAELDFMQDVLEEA